MLPIGPLMIEHRLIERMIQIMKVQLEIIQAGKKEDSAQVVKIIRFIRAYADLFHQEYEDLAGNFLAL